MDIAQKVYSLQIAESGLQKAFAELGAANQKIRSLEASCSMASDARSNKNYIMDYTRLKVVSDAANIAALSRDPEGFVRNLDSRLQAPMRIADESEHSGRTGEGSAESSRRLLKEKAEKEHYVSAYGLLRGPFP